MISLIPVLLIVELCNIIRAKRVVEVAALGKDYKPGIVGGLWIAANTVYFIWCCYGVFTSQGHWVLGVLILGFIPKKAVWWVVVDAVCSIVILLVIYTNAN